MADVILRSDDQMVEAIVMLLMLVTLLGKSWADGHVIRSNITCLITLLQVVVVVVVSHVT